ncbi:MAG: ribbon-helix-helix protein, CopG family [Planctomycetes bacterium]|nr:ribbon-helix-helix protein, CopG family [Planctomycetota bacterium]
MKTLTLKLPESQFSRLDDLARRSRTSRSAVVRQAIDRLLSDRKTTAGISALAVARHVVGSVEGPRDLSVGRAHMKGYGE